MSELILHHYAGSPFSEKLRLLFGWKSLAWRSVEVPVMLPKPDVVALTGGYRRTPFLQIGADIYCDTALICRVVDALHPSPALNPPALAGSAHILAQWADSDLFWAAIPYAMQPAGAAAIFAGAPPAFLQAFAADRAAMTAGMKRPSTRDAGAALQSYLSWLEAQLQDGRAFLLAEAPCVADFAVAQSLWYLRRAGPVAEVLAPFAALNAWFERMRAFGHGQSEKMTSAEAIALAREAMPREPLQVLPGLGIEEGEAVTVTPTDYACDAVAGELVGLSHNRVSLRRLDERAGLLHVHFPRIGFALRKQEQEQ